MPKLLTSHAAENEIRNKEMKKATGLVRKFRFMPILLSSLIKLSRETFQPTSAMTGRSLSCISIITRRESSWVSNGVSNEYLSLTRTLHSISS
jgi:hypothetical protein